MQGKKDEMVVPEETARLAEKLKSQKNITVDYEEITGANHFYDNEKDRLEKVVRKYIEKELNSKYCLLYTSPSPRDLSTSRMPSSA